ncbi:MAG: toxin-antitoxin system protein [Desulfotomaculaceae bacterium]|nr:toxin-antitoxin system protein [Desulfotomaculaceae bacterium]
MPSTTVRISHSTWKTLREIADRVGEPMQAVLDKAIEEYRRKCFLEEANRAYLALRNNPDAWKDEIEERVAWDVTLNDGLRKED